MALDANGRPIPVFVPPPPAPPTPLRAELGAPQPDIENDIGQLHGAVEELNTRLLALERFAPKINKMESRVDALETGHEVVMQLRTRFGVVEEAVEGMPKLFERIAELEIAQREAVLRLSDLELQKEEHVAPSSARLRSRRALSPRRRSSNARPTGRRLISCAGSRGRWRPSADNLSSISHSPAGARGSMAGLIEIRSTTSAFLCEQHLYVLTGGHAHRHLADAASSQPDAGRRGRLRRRHLQQRRFLWHAAAYLDDHGARQIAILVQPR